MFNEPSRVLALLLLAGGLGLVLSGCSDSTKPASSGGDEGEALVAGNLDPHAGTFVLRSLDEPIPGTDRPVPIQLIGSNLQIDPESETVSLDVALRNRWTAPLFAPAMVWLSDFTPEDITVLNPDLIAVPIGIPPPWDGLVWDSQVAGGELVGDPQDDPLDNPEFDPPPVYGFVYSELLGDGILEPGETSAAKTWEFHVPGLVAFSFAARATFGLVPDLPRIAGICFEDVNRNGQLDSRDQPLPGGRVVMHDPTGQMMITHPNHMGEYVFPVHVPGLYSLTYHPQLDVWYCLPHFTTPNHLEVMLPPLPDGQPVSFLEAHFGFYCDTPPSIPPVILTDVPMDSLVGAPYHLLGLELEGNILHLAVGFSGCQPEHPFTLYMPGGFMESLPVQANLVLVHELD